MNLRQYPLDSQNFTMTFQSYAYSHRLEQIQFIEPPVEFNFDPEQNENFVLLNQIWTYERYSADITLVKSSIRAQH